MYISIFDVLFFFFFKQKTAYEVRISDWSSEVCSSDLIGFAADTPNGLVVPVVRDCDRKGVMEIAAETGELAAKAREGKLGPAQMSGGCFSISSLGGIGGTSFTPIVHEPDGAIPRVSTSVMKPLRTGRQFKTRRDV